jgi:hypothetical protein
MLARTWEAHMGALARDAHRRRVLEYQEKAAAERRVAPAEPTEPQFKIPLIGEVKRTDNAPQAKRRRSQGKKYVQPELGEP